MQPLVDSEPPFLPRSFFILTGAAAVAAGLSIPGSPPGANWTVIGALAVAAVWVARAGALERPDYGLVGLALILLGFFTIRSAPWLLAVNLVFIVALVAIAMARAQSWAGILISLARALMGLPHGIVLVLRPVGGRAARDFKLTPILRTLTMMVGAVAVFGGLFASADPAFATLAGDLLVPPFDLSMIPIRGATALGVAALAGSLTMRSFDAVATDTTSASERRAWLGGVEWKATLGLIDLLFAGFVAVQLAVLFGGDEHVLDTTGLTYAEYAREGFFQLIVASASTLVVIAVAVRVAGAHRAERTWLRALLGVLCVLTLVVLASASKRVTLYQEAYGFTRLRLLAALVILVLGCTFVLLIVAGTMWKASWLPRAIVFLGAAALIGFNAYNPDARIAEKNIDRFSRTTQIDLRYLASLSADAVPELMRLSEPERSCVLARLDDALAEPPAPWSWNLARARAHIVLRESLPIGTRCLAGD